MRIIELTQSRHALVSNSDYQYLSQWTWCCQRIGKTFYAARVERQNGRRRYVYMHRVVADRAGRLGARVDHFDGDGLNNQRSNLRSATHQQNLWNRGKNRNNSTGFKGVYPCKSQNNPFYAQIVVDGKNHYLGCYQSKRQAALAYNEAARQHFGRYANLNRV